MRWIRGFVWDGENLAHIGRHQVSPEEVEEGQGEALLREEAKGQRKMKRQPKIPKFEDDREAAEFWATHDSTPYQRQLRQVGVKVSPSLRRRIAARAETKKPVTLRLEPRQIAAAKLVAREKSVPYQTLLRMWIAEGLKKEHAS